jgi:hypothetical protein
VHNPVLSCPAPPLGERVQMSVSALETASDPPNPGLIIPSLSNATFEANGEELLRLDRELHGQLLQHLFAETIDDERQRSSRESPRWWQ